MLPFYAERFRTVEINNTFYRMPSESVLATWTGQVPDSFRFVLKAPRRITHRKRLREVEEEDLARHVAFVTSRGWERVHVFFKHEDEGTGPALAIRFLALADPGSAAPDGSTHTTA